MSEVADETSRAMAYSHDELADSRRGINPAEHGLTTLKTKEVDFNWSGKYTYLKLTVDFCDLGLVILNESHLRDNP